MDCELVPIIAVDLRVAVVGWPEKCNLVTRIFELDKAIGHTEHAVKTRHTVKGLPYMDFDSHHKT